MNINEVYEIIESIANGNPFDISVCCNNFYANEKRTEYRIYIQKINSDQVTGKSFEECLNKLAMTIQREDGHFYKKILRSHKKKLELHKILFRKF